MDVDSATPAAQFTIDREKTAPFLIRTFVKIGGFHRLTQFEDGAFPTTDEHQLFTWKDATLREVLTTLRTTAPHVAEYRHPLARFSFRIVYADPGNKGRFAQKEIGMVYSRDILGEPGTLTSTAPRLLLDVEPSTTRGEREERTLEDLRFMPGDFLIVAVLLPKSVTVPTELSIKGSGATSAPANGWKTAGASATASGGPPPGKGDSGWGRGSGPGSAAGNGSGRGGHWRGGSDAPSGRGRGGGGGRGGDLGRDREKDRDQNSRVPPPRRRDSPPPPRGGRGGRGRSRTRSRSRSRTPPRRRRYD